MRRVLRDPLPFKSIPIALTGSDILARAKNGTGKTAAFCIPAIEKIDQNKNAVQGVVLDCLYAIYCIFTHCNVVFFTISW
jgi:hypothetical protein